MENPLLFAALLTFTISVSSYFTKEVIPATGGNTTGSQGPVRYSIGRIVYSTHAGEYGTVAEGIQRSREISIATGIQEATGISLIVPAFPIPATDYLVLRVDN